MRPEAIRGIFDGWIFRDGAVPTEVDHLEDELRVRIPDEVQSLLRMIVALVSLVACPPVLATEDVKNADTTPTLRERMTDPQDGQFDLSYFLAHPRGFLPVPIIVTEPAVGYGGGLALMFLRPRREASDEGWVRPDMSAVGGLATVNGTWGGFAGDSSYWLGGRLHTTAGGGTGRANLDFSGLGDSVLRDVGVPYSLDFAGGIFQADWQVVAGAPWWLGARFTYATIDPRLRDQPTLPGLVDGLRSTISAPTLLLTYDSRDNVFTPTRGVYSETSYMASRESLGASVQFSRAGETFIAWWPAHPTVTLALRADLQSASGGTPFYMLPYVDMRGVPAMRYAGNRMISGQGEMRWRFHGRWSAVVFAGAGETRSEQGPLAYSDRIASGGAGFRYELARKFGLHVGLDLAHSPGTTAFYIIVGNAWFRP